MTDDDHPRIVRVELLPESLRTWRDLNGMRPNTYPVLLHLSRPLDEFERDAIRGWAHLIPGEHDAATIVLPDYALEAVRQNFHALNGQILNAATRGCQVRDAAYAEDDRLRDLEAEINEELGNPRETDELTYAPTHIERPTMTNPFEALNAAQDAVAPLYARAIVLGYNVTANMSFAEGHDPHIWFVVWRFDQPSDFAHLRHHRGGRPVPRPHRDVAGLLP